MRQLKNGKSNRNWRKARRRRCNKRTNHCRAHHRPKKNSPALQTTQLDWAVPLRLTPLPLHKRLSPLQVIVSFLTVIGLLICHCSTSQCNITSNTGNPDAVNDSTTCYTEIFGSFAKSAHTSTSTSSCSIGNSTSLPSSTHTSASPTTTSKFILHLYVNCLLTFL